MIAGETLGLAGRRRALNNAIAAQAFPAVHLCPSVTLRGKCSIERYRVTVGAGAGAVVVGAAGRSIS